MKKWSIAVGIWVLLLLITGCGRNGSVSSVSKSSVSNQKESALSVIEETKAAREDTESDAESSSEETMKISIESKEENMPILEITVGKQQFLAVLYDNAAARAFLERLPVTISMKELNGNEKYYYFSDSFPTASSVPSEIQAGDLMLYGSDCLVLFYKSFSTNYSYTPLGYLKDPSRLASALGDGSAELSFAVKEEK